ncbi:Uncharacterized protein PECH_004298 [Penicillium ucsense]|uniref:Uncharacterized protein n=1 Tax=Penicillium ucsense TaxID=2839758 RepID=A0A8J8WJ91_9EURO|nr:Uncharacterized protein PECM_001139 [Penicillium ucsense]KAF7737183.1 Uncharacterized protein PECH_004298 [Penicillium ucsense]
MKFLSSTLVAGFAYASISAALPFQDAFSSRNPTALSNGHNVAGQRSPFKQFHVGARKPHFLEYIQSLRTQTSWIANEPTHTSPSLEHEAHIDSDRDRAFRDHYGTVFRPSSEHSSHDHDDNSRVTASTQTSHHPSAIPLTDTKTSFESIDLLDLFDKHGPECVALVMFVLIPIAYVVLGMIEFALRCCTCERFPDRGRDRVRLLGEERQLRAWSNQQREQMLENEKRWWEPRRSRS